MFEFLKSTKERRVDTTTTGTRRYLELTAAGVINGQLPAGRQKEYDGLLRDLSAEIAALTPQKSADITHEVNSERPQPIDPIGEITVRIAQHHASLIAEDRRLAQIVGTSEDVGEKIAAAVEKYNDHERESKKIADARDVEWRRLFSEAEHLRTMRERTAEATKARAALRANHWQLFSDASPARKTIYLIPDAEVATHYKHNADDKAPPNKHNADDKAPPTPRQWSAVPGGTVQNLDTVTSAPLPQNVQFAPHPDLKPGEWSQLKVELSRWFASFKGGTEAVFVS